MLLLLDMVLTLLVNLFELDMLWISDSIRRGELELVKIETKDQLVDIGTKFIVSGIFFYLRSILIVSVDMSNT